MTLLTSVQARKILGIPPRGDFTEEMLQSAWREAAKVAHPDNGGSSELIIQVNQARDLLQPMALKALSERSDETPNKAKPRTPAPSNVPTVLTISPTGHLFGEQDQYLGNCLSVAGAIAYCGAAGWKYRQTAELTAGQRRVLREAA